MGPAVEQLPALSQIDLLPVDASPVSVPPALFVVSEKLASPKATKPDVGSVEVHAMETSDPCHDPSAAPHETAGPVASRLMVTD